MATIIPGEASETDDDENDCNESSKKEDANSVQQNNEELRFGIFTFPLFFITN